MNDIEELLRAAFHDAAESMPPEGLRPVPRPMAQPHSRRGRQRARRLAYPVLAAIAVLLVATAPTLIPHFLSRTTGGSAADLHMRGLSPDAPTGPPPRFFAELSGAGDAIEFLSSSTGQPIAQVSPPKRGDFFSGVAAEPDDRTFVLAVEQASGGGCTTHLFRVRLDQRGHPGKLYQLPGQPISGTLSTSTMALSPDGSELAYFAYDCAGSGELEVSDLANGDTTSWSGEPGESVLSISLSRRAQVISFSGSMFDGYGPGAKAGTSSVRLRPITAILRLGGPPAAFDTGAIVIPEYVQVALSPSGTTLYTCRPRGSSDVLSAYNVATRNLLAVIARWPRHDGSCSAAMAPNGGYLLLGDVSNHLAILNLHTGRLLTTGPGLYSARRLAW